MVTHKQTQDQNKATNEKEHNEKRGFASMPKEKVQEIAHKGGEARAEQLGHEGMAEMGRKGGRHSHGSTSSKNTNPNSDKDNIPHKK